MFPERVVVSHSGPDLVPGPLAPAAAVAHRGWGVAGRLGIGPETSSSSPALGPSPSPDPQNPIALQPS